MREAVFFVCVTILFALFAGTPDLMDAIILWVRCG